MVASALRAEPMPAQENYWSQAGDARPFHHRHVTVIGAGIIGLASAAALVRSGRQVTVLDAATAVGRGTSYGNGCQLSYGYVAPLAQPGLPAELPHLLLSRGAPLRIVPQLDLAQWRWMLQFLRACRPSQARAGSLELLALGQLSRQETDSWLDGADLEKLCFSRNGKLVLLPTQSALSKATQQLEMQAPYGPVQQVLDASEVLQIEPALKAFSGHMAGAIQTPDECAIDSHALCLDLEKRLRARGVVFELGMPVRYFRRSGDRITHVETDLSRREVDGLVIATGSASAAIARRLGFYLPVYPLKGYSITVPIRDAAGVPRASVTDAARKVVYARIGDRLRVAGVAELRGYDEQIDPTRIAGLVESTRDAFGAATDVDAATAWAGLRPATPTSVPIIGTSPLNNVFLNVGHGALGLTLAFGAARRLVNVLDGATR